MRTVSGHAGPSEDGRQAARRTRTGRCAPLVARRGGLRRFALRLWGSGETVTSVPFDVPDSVIKRVSGRYASSVVDVLSDPLPGGTGAATAGLERLTIRALSSSGDVDRFSVVRKSFRPLRSGRHQHGAENPGHWAYWKRELLAYASDILPSGPGLKPPLCHGVSDSTIYLEDVGSAPADAGRAARQLGRWQSVTTVPHASWLSGDQLAQRIEASKLNWSAVHTDRRAARLWDARHRLLAELSQVPVVLSHGDFHQGNLRATECDTVVLDWGTLGLAPVGSDLAHLALSTQKDLHDEYLAGLNDQFPEHLVTMAYRATLVLVGSSRLHWMLSRGIDVPDGYIDFLWTNRPDVDHT